MQKLTPLQRALVDRHRAYLPATEQRRIAQAKLFAAAVLVYPRTRRLSLLSQVSARGLLRTKGIRAGG